MLCKIADLFTDIPEEGGIAPLLEEYKVENKYSADIKISAEAYNYERCSGLSVFDSAYVEAGLQFNYWLLRFDGMMLHSSAVEYEGRAYLFSGPSGMGKSTHTGLWKKNFPSAEIFNDDKPALRRMDGIWYAYGTPWSGKNHVNVNKKVPLSAICFLKRGSENSIKRLTAEEATPRLISQTMRIFRNAEDLNLMLSRVEALVREVPIFELYALPNDEAAMLSYKAMSDASGKQNKA